MACSKPKLPLGVSHVVNRRTCVLFEPLESAPPPTCPICLDPLRWGRHYDLRCNHSVCVDCVRKDAVHRISAAGHADAAFPCPLCRHDAHTCVVVERDGEAVPRGTLLHCVEDAYGNAHVVACEQPGGFIGRVVADAPPYERSQLITINPYRGWIAVPRLSLNANPTFTVLYRARSPSEDRRMLL